MTTISMIIPVLAELHLHLEQLKNSPDFVDTVRLMQLKLRERFDYITNPRATNFDPLFTICTFLNPEYKDILNEDQELVATTRLITWMTSYPEVVNQVNQWCKVLQMMIMIVSHLQKNSNTSRSLLIEKRRAAKESAVETMLQPEVEVKKYTEMNTSSNSLDDDRDPFIFWQQNEYAYPLLSKAAFDLLSTPPSSTPVERIFSTGGEATTGKRNRLANHNLEREVLL